jgi:hypothetical protein
MSPMIDMTEARSKVEAYCREVGRDPDELRWEGGGQLFLNDDPIVQERAVHWAMEQYNQTEGQPEVSSSARWKRSAPASASN